MGEVLGYGLTVGTQVVILFLLILTGFVATKCKMINQNGSTNMTDLLLFVVTPAVIIKAFMNVELSSELVVDLLIAVGCAILTHFVNIIVGLVFCKVKPIDRSAVYRFTVLFSNAGFMSLPLAQALLSDRGVLLASMYVIVFNIFVWVYGITLFPSVKSVSKRKALINPGTAGVVLGIGFVFISPENIPQIVGESVGYIASLNTPLAMVMTGFFLANSKLGDGFNNKYLWSVVGLRLIICPLLVLCIYKYAFGFSGELLQALIIPASAPSAVNATILAAKFGGDTETATKIITVATVLSVITMPLMLMITKI